MFQPDGAGHDGRARWSATSPGARFGQYDLPIPRPPPAPTPTSCCSSCPTSTSSPPSGACPPTTCACGSACTRWPTTPCSACPTCGPAWTTCSLQLRVRLPQRPRAPSRTASAQIDLSDPAALANLQEVIGSPEVILGAITSPEQDALRPQLEALVATVEGVVDHVVDVVGGELIAGYADAHRGAAPPPGRGRPRPTASSSGCSASSSPRPPTTAAAPSSPAWSSGPAQDGLAPPLGRRRACCRPRPRSTPPASGSPASTSDPAGSGPGTCRPDLATPGQKRDTVLAREPSAAGHVPGPEVVVEGGSG